MEKGHFGHYSGNARHSRTPVTKRNYRASVADDAAHIHYLEEDMKYDKKHHSPFKQMDERSGEGVDEFGTRIPEGFKADVEPQTLTPEKMYTRDIGKDQGEFGTSDFIPGRKYSQEKRELGSIGDRIKQKPGYRYQFTSVSGDTDPSPTNPFITKDFDEQGDVIKNAKVLGKKGASGLIGRSFSQQDVEEMKGRFERYMAPKRKAQEYFKSKKS